MSDTKAAPVILGIGAAGLMGLGVYLFMKKPPGVSPGEGITAHFKFDYIGEADKDYEIQLRLGYHRLANWFDLEEGLVWQKGIHLPIPEAYEFDLKCIIPDGTPARTYDAEGAIRVPGMSPGDYLIRVFQDKAVTVRKE